MNSDKLLEFGKFSIERLEECLFTNKKMVEKKKKSASKIIDDLKNPCNQVAIRQESLVPENKDHSVPSISCRLWSPGRSYIAKLTRRKRANF